jgi:hypothetical protein
VRGAEEAKEERTYRQHNIEGEDQDDERNEDQEADRHAAEKWRHYLKALALKNGILQGVPRHASPRAQQCRLPGG